MSILAAEFSFSGAISYKQDNIRVKIWDRGKIYVWTKFTRLL